MSWFKRKKDWAAKEILTAGDLDSEFDNVAEALNTLFQSGAAIASGSLELTSSLQDVPGTSTAVTAPRASLLIAWVTADGGGSQTYVVSLPTGAHTLKLRAKKFVFLTSASYVVLNVDGSDQSAHATVGTAEEIGKYTGFGYLLIPGP
jgi:hypothetical protein